jgi:gas vesicle protein
MNRRDVLVGVGAGAAVFAAAGASLADDKGHEHHEHLMACARACAACALECEGCFRHCADALKDGKKEHATTLHTCVDCADCCRMTAALVARRGPFAAHAVECCVKCTEACAAACEKFPDDKQMAACAKACRDCLKACREAAKHLAH